MPWSAYLRIEESWKEYSDCKETAFNSEIAEVIKTYNEVNSLVECNTHKAHWLKEKQWGTTSNLLDEFD